MTDQLSLRLDAGLPNLPEIRPMLPRTATAAFDSTDHLFEPAWGGARALALVGPARAAGLGPVRFVGLDGEPLEVDLPELAGMASRIAARSAVLDGELVVVDADGRSDGAGLASRLAGRPGRPVAYLAFDLVHLDGRSLLGQPLARRRDLLRDVLRPGDEVVAVPAFRTEGRALYAAATDQGIAGVMARHRTSPYLPGVRSRLWQFVPCEQAAPGGGDDASSSGAIPDDAGPMADASESAATSAAEGPESTEGAGPDRPAGRVMALIRRLPLPLDED